MTLAQTDTRIHRLRFISLGGEEEVPVVTQSIKPELVSSPAEPAPPPPPPPPTFSEKDIQAARAEGYNKGHNEGFATGQAKAKKEDEAREEAIKSLLDVIANRITLAAESHGNHIKEQHDIMGKLVLAIARKLAGEALKRTPYAAVESLLRECIGVVTNEPNITIVVTPALASGLRQRVDVLKSMLPGFEGAILVEEDPAMGEQDCRVQWKAGYAEHDAEALWTIMEGIIMRTNLNTKENV